AISTVRSLDRSSQTINSKSVSDCASTLSIASAMKSSRLYEVSRTLMQGDGDNAGDWESARPGVGDAVRQLRGGHGGEHHEARALERRLRGTSEGAVGREPGCEAEARRDRQR